MTDKAEFESVGAYARRMGVSAWTVRQWIKKGRVRAEQPTRPEWQLPHPGRATRRGGLTAFGQPIN